MIARLEGVLREKNPESVILDVGGVGYEVRVALSVFLELPDEGKTLALRIHTYVREDSLQLFGFQTTASGPAFGCSWESTASGRGSRWPYSRDSRSKARQCRARGRRSRAEGIPGIGAKTAQRMLVELRDKVEVSPRRNRADLKMIWKRQPSRHCSTSATPEVRLSGWCAPPAKHSEAVWTWKL